MFAAALFPLYRPVKVTHLDFGRCVQRAHAANARAHKGRFINQHSNNMTYVQDFEMELIKKLRGNETEETLVRWVTEKVIESYRNGIKAGQNGVVVKRDGKSRRRDSFGRTE